MIDKWLTQGFARSTQEPEALLILEKLVMTPCHHKDHLMYSWLRAYPPCSPHVSIIEMLLQAAKRLINKAF